MPESHLHHRPADHEARHEPREAARASTVPRSGELERSGPGRYVLIAAIALAVLIGLYVLAFNVL